MGGVEVGWFGCVCMDADASGFQYFECTDNTVHLGICTFSRCTNADDSLERVLFGFCSNRVAALGRGFLYIAK